MQPSPVVCQVRSISDLQEEEEPDSQLQYEEYSFDADIYSEGGSIIDDEEEEIADDIDKT